MTSDPESFARATIVERKPQIIRQVAEDSDYPAGILLALEAFRREIESRPLKPLHEAAADVPAWNGEVSRYAGRTWLEIPWYFAETYFYRKLLEAVQYLQPGPWQGHDPFGLKKARQLALAVDHMTAGWDELNQAEPDVAFEALLHSALWGNRADLSNFNVREQAHGGLAATAERRHLLIDDSRQVHELLASGLRRVDFVNDNVGMDVLFDLALADFLLRQRWVEQVTFHLKDRPFFVSDAMPSDVKATEEALALSSHPGLRAFGQRLRSYRANQRWAMRTDPFWTSFRSFRDLSAPLHANLAASDLLILKGDVNYRRLLDDRHWPPTTSVESIAQFFGFPRPFLLLRTLKGEIIAGLQPGQAEYLSTQDPDWLIDGKRGIIQLVLHASGAQPS